MELIKLIWGILIFVFVFLVGYLLGSSFSDFRATGLAVQEQENASLKLYSWTTAICGTNNKCLDVNVECDGNRILNITPVSKLIEHEPEWRDFRENKELCPKG